MNGRDVRLALRSTCVYRHLEGSNYALTRSQTDAVGGTAFGRPARDQRYTALGGPSPVTPVLGTILRRGDLHLVESQAGLEELCFTDF